MLVVNYNGNKPITDYFKFSVKGNNKADVIRFVVEKEQESLDLSNENYFVYVKCDNGFGFVDKVLIRNITITDNELLINWVLLRKHTQNESLKVALCFEDRENEVVWQTQTFTMKINNSVVADTEIANKYPTILQELQEEVDSKQEQLVSGENIKTINGESILGEGNIDLGEGSHEIIIDNPDDYLNESGLRKLIRENESGTIEKTYLIDKIYKPSTLIQAIPTYEDNGTDISENVNDYFVNNVGSDNFYGVFGENAICTGNENVFTLYYNLDDVETFGFTFGNFEGQDAYGFFELDECEPNKKITLVVGKYFEYDAQGNKVFDEHSCIYSEHFFENPENFYREITEERQEFELKTDENGYIYFDSDGNELGFGNTRFILYEIKCGEPESTVYKKREISSGGNVDNSIPNVEIERVYLTYDDKRTLVGDFLGVYWEDEAIVNDSTRTWVNFKTTPISNRIEEEISKGRFVIRLDYHANNQKTRISKTALGNGIHYANVQNRYGIGTRSFARNFKDLRENKKQILLNSLIFIEPSDIKVNRYGEKYILKRISYFDYISRICKFRNGEFLPTITRDWVSNNQNGSVFFADELDVYYPIGIPHLRQTGMDIINSESTLFNGQAKNKITTGIDFAYYGSNVKNGHGTTDKPYCNGSKLNPAFSCYAPINLVNIDESDMCLLYSPYFINGKKGALSMIRNANDDGWNIGRPKATKKAYMSAKPRCAILSDNYRTDEYAFLKVYPQADQQIKLYCKNVLEKRRLGIECMPIFRMLITQK